MKNLFFLDAGDKNLEKLFQCGYLQVFPAYVVYHHLFLPFEILRSQFPSRRPQLFFGAATLRLIVVLMLNVVAPSPTVVLLGFTTELAEFLGQSKGMRG